jgi:hypothetical protein
MGDRRNIIATLIGLGHVLLLLEPTYVETRTDAVMVMV